MLTFWQKKAWIFSAQSKNMCKRLIAFFTVISLMLVSVACKKEKVYGHCERVINLDGDFYEEKNNDFDACYTNGKYVVGILRISFDAAYSDGISDALNARQFGAFWLTKCERNVEIQRHKDIDYAEYEEVVLGTEYYYLASFYRSNYAYFVVLFGTQKKDMDEGRVKFLDYSTDIYFLENYK